MQKLYLTLIVMVLITACAAPTATPRSAPLTSTERPFPTFGPTRTQTPTRTPQVTATTTPSLTLAPTETPTPARASSVTRSIGQPATKKSAGAAAKIARVDAPAALRQALAEAGVNGPHVYWFTFDEGDREVALMIQYDSPLRWQPGYLDMLRNAQRVVGRYFLLIDPPIYSAFIAGTDIAGDSDITVRLRRSSAEKLARGEIGEEDFVNNYFEYVNVVMKCSADGCLAKMATPFPTFDFPFPFVTPTKVP
jgi:hypothetical protein